MILLLSATALNNSVHSWIAGSMRLSELTGLQIKSFLLVLLEDASRTRTPPTIDDAKRQWTQLVEHDDRLQSMLVATLAQVPAVAEVSVADLRDRVIASSNTARIGAPIAIAPSLAGLESAAPWTRIAGVFGRSRDYEQRILLGLEGESLPVFTIQVLVSNALLREAVWPELRLILAAFALSLAASGLLIYYAARRGAHHLAQLTQLIDRILSGDQQPDVTLGADLAVVETKLNLLGTQYRGAVRDAANLRGNLSALLERLTDVTLLVDGDGRVILAGGPCERLLGVTPKAGELVPIKAIAATVAARKPLSGAALAHGQTALTMDIEFPGGDGPALVRIRDTETGRRLERELAATSKLDAINRLTGGVAHEIKNPLNSISARLALLESMVEENPEAAEELRVIAQEVDRLDHVVRTFLDFTRPVELEMEPVDIAAAVRELAALLTPEAAQRGVAVQVNAQAADFLVQGDSTLLRQALTNLASNAMDAMPNGGRLAFQLEQRNGDCVLTVSDTGQGIPQEQRERIFQLYYTTKKNGSGIGLAMAYRAVQLHGGRMDVESAPGMGAAFRITLPLAKAAAQ